MAGVRGMSLGERNGRAKLSEQTARRVLALRAEGWTHRQLAARFCLSRGTVGDLCRGRRWPHLRKAA